MKADAEADVLPECKKQAARGSVVGVEPAGTEQGSKWGR